MHNYFKNSMRLFPFLLMLLGACTKGEEFYLQTFDRPKTASDESEEIHFSSVKDIVVPSWNMRVRGSASGRFFLRYKSAQGWTKWYGVGEWGLNGQALSATKQKDEFGEVISDTFVAFYPSKVWQFRWELTPDEKGIWPQLDNFALSAVNRDAFDKKINGRGPVVKPLAVPELSQYVEGTKQKLFDPSRLCSPISVLMLLRFFGLKEENILTVLDGTMDARIGFPGVWPFNTAYIYQALKVRSPDKKIMVFSRWFESIDDLLKIVKAGTPVPVSIRYKEGQLDGSPKPTAGHILVIRGSDENHILVNDPADPDGHHILRRYKRKQFIKAWRGLAYIVLMNR